MSRKTVSALTAAIFAMSSSLAFAGSDGAPVAPAAATAHQGVLAPGASAGTKAAQMFEGNTALYVGLGLVIIGGGAYLIANNNNGSHRNTSSTSTAP